jgi:parallel beta-helix repeat protein
MMTTAKHIATASIVATLFVAPTAVPAATLHVGAGQTYATIQAALNASSDGDSIVVHDGTYVENVTVDTRVAIVSQDFLDNGEYDGAILDAGSNYVTGMTVSSQGVTVEGMSFTGITILAYGIHLSTADNCRIANNRFGWDDDHWANTGVYLQESDSCVIEYNLFGRGGGAGVYIDQSSDTEVRYNTFQNISGTGAAGVALSGIYDISGSNCRRNTIWFNDFSDNWIGVYASGQVWQNHIVGNTFTTNVRGVFLGPGGLKQNLVEGNILTNNGMNIVLDGASYNTIVDNTLNGEGTGIRIGYQSPYTGNYNIIMFNSIWNHALGMYIGAAATGNRMMANSYIGNTVNVESHGTDWNSATYLSYFYGSNHRNLLGNYYDTYAGSDTDGDGVGDTGLPFDDGDPTTGPVENYPLVSPPDQYAIEAWYLQADSLHTMYHRDMTRPVGEWTVDGSQQIVWTSAETANGSIDYPNGTWTGCVNFEVAPSPGDFTLELGSSSNGTDFTTSGLQASIGGAIENTFETSAAALSVPDGHYLAVRLTNNTEWSHKLIMGGLMCYISSTGNGDPEWPGEPTAVGETAPSPISLRQNYPNPFNPTTTIEFYVPERTEATVRVYDVRGRYLSTLISETVGPGMHTVQWDGRDRRGAIVSSGVYFYRLTTPGHVKTRKMVLMK